MEKQNPLNWKRPGFTGIAVLVALALAVVLVLPVLAAPTAQTGAAIPNTITVTGTGEASGTPDVAYISLGVDITNPDAGQAVTDANAQMDTLVEAIRALGVDPADIQTVSFNVWPEDRYDPQTGAPTGERVYHVQNIVNISVRDIAQVGTVIDTGLKSGANSVNGLSFGIDDTSALEQEARLKAVDDARNRAQQLADDFGVSLGQPVVIVESSGNGTIPLYATARLEAVGGGGSSVSPGELSVNMVITVTFAIGG
jgi:uncharacterized protein YggE